MLYLVDASIFVFRAHHTVPNTLTDPDGNPVNALHGFARFLGDLIERVRPEHLAVAFDSTQRDSFRYQLYPAYKANRERPPEELRRQFSLCRRVCQALGVAHFVSPGFEADDIIGTLATNMRGAGTNVVLVTRDKDLAQLVRPGDHYWDYIGDKRYPYHAISDRFGVLPERMPCFQALLGDAIDNIPGVPGIGRKTASLLFKHFESLLQLYGSVDSGGDSLGRLKLRNVGFVLEQLRTYRESAFLARQLTQIACDVPLTVDLAQLRRRRPDLRQLNGFYDEVGFGRMLRQQGERLLALHAA